MEVTNQTLIAFLISSVSKSLKDWDVKLPCANFAYNRDPSYVTKHLPFECVYEAEVRAKNTKKLHE